MEAGMAVKALLTILAFAYACLSESISIRGIVRDSVTSATLKGVEVRLLQKGLIDTTDASGNFSFGWVSVKRGASGKLVDVPEILSNGIVKFTTRSNEIVGIQLFTIDGKSIFNGQNEYPAGTYILPTPVKTAGIYFYRIRIGENVYSRKIVSLGGSNIRRMAGSQHSLTNEATSLAKTTDSAEYKDSIVLLKDGYCSLSSSISSNISNATFKMRPVSLINGVEPGFIIGKTNQDRTFTIAVGPDRKTIDSINIITIMLDCAYIDHSFNIKGPFVIPSNGVVTIGDSIKLAFSDSSVSGSFSTSQVVIEYHNPPCYETVNSGGIIQMVPYYDHRLHLIDPVTFSSISYKLHVNGQVERNPSRDFYLQNETVMLIADPDTMHHFSSWSGDVSRISKDTAWVFMNGSKTVTANYSDNYLIKIESTNGSAYQYPLAHNSFLPGDTVMLLAEPEKNYIFIGWGGDTSWTNSDTAWVVMNGNKNIKLDFKQVYNLYIDSTLGHVEIIPHKTTFMPGGNDTVLLVARPDSGFKFWSWNGPVFKSSRDSAWIIMDSTKIIQSIFELTSAEAMLADSESIESVAISPDGSLVALGKYNSNEIILWNWSTNDQKTISGDFDWVMDLVFSPDGSQLLAGTGRFKAHLIDMNSLSIIHSFNCTKPVNKVAFSPDGNKITTDNTMWDAVTYDSLVTIQDADFISAFSDDGKYLATKDLSSHKVSIFDITKGLKTRVFVHSYNIVNAVFSSDGQKLLTVTDFDAKLSIWNLATGDTLKTFKAGWHSTYLAEFTADRSKVIVNDGEYDINTGNSVDRFYSHLGGYKKAAISSNGKYLVTASADTSRTVFVWKLK
jgi:WD40 repeat protein